MKKRRNHTRYELRDKGKVVYVGITSQPVDERVDQHQQDGKRFTSVKKAGPLVTKDSAEEWEENRLEQYRHSHKGKNPRYNKTNQ